MQLRVVGTRNRERGRSGCEREISKKHKIVIMCARAISGKLLTPHVHPL